MAHQMYVFVVCACFFGFSASLGRPRLMPGGLYPDARPVDATASEVVNSVSTCTFQICIFPEFSIHMKDEDHTTVA